MGAIWWGTQGRVPPTFGNRGDIICHVPPTLYPLNFAFEEVSKINVPIVTFCLKNF